MCANEIKVIENDEKGVIQSVEMKTITEYLDTTGLTKQLLPNEKAMFINMARDYGLNPFKREIYCNVYGQGQYRQCAIVTGYEVYLKRAERIGKLNGWNTSISGSLRDGTLSATVTIYRKDWEYPFQHTVYYTECVQLNGKTGQPNKVWAKMPIFMTKKVAIAQAFRLCFSDEFGGMPYTSDEMGVENTPQEEKNITEQATSEVTGIEPNSGEVIENTEEIPADIPANNDRETLKKIVELYEDELAQSKNCKALNMCCEALAENDPAMITEMVGRSIAYLGKKGIKVAV